MRMSEPAKRQASAFTEGFLRTPFGPLNGYPGDGGNQLVFAIRLGNPGTRGGVPHVSALTFDRRICRNNGSQGEKGSGAYRGKC